MDPATIIAIIQLIKLIQDIRSNKDIHADDIAKNPIIHKAINGSQGDISQIIVELQELDLSGIGEFIGGVIDSVLGTSKSQDPETHRT